MTSRLLIAGVAAGCVAAAGVGGFLAVRTATHTSEAASVGAPLSAGDATQADAPAAHDQEVAPTVASGTTVRSTPSISRATRPAVGSESDPASMAPTPTESAVVAPPPSLSVPTAQSATIPMHTGPSVALAGPRVEMVELPANAVIGIQLETTVSSETANVEDAVRARVTRPVIVDGVTLIPAGARLSGLVTAVERGGRFRERSRIGVRFTSVAVADNAQVPIRTETIYRVGDAPTGEATAKIGASAVVGSILGGVFGGKKGAAIGAATGAAGGTAIVAADGPNEAVLASGATFTVRLSEPAVFEVGR